MFLVHCNGIEATPASKIGFDDMPPIQESKYKRNFAIIQSTHEEAYWSKSREKLRSSA